MKLADIAAEMRAAGVRRVVGEWRKVPALMEMTAQGSRVIDPERVDFLPREIELFDPASATEPAPPIELEPDASEEDKPPGSCAALGCIAKAGFHFAPAFCEKHGLAELGVRG